MSWFTLFAREQAPKLRYQPALMLPPKKLDELRLPNLMTSFAADNRWYTVRMRQKVSVNNERLGEAFHACATEGYRHSFVSLQQ